VKTGRYRLCVLCENRALCTDCVCIRTGRCILISYVCVCVCVRERERERESRALYTDCVHENWELPLYSDSVVLVQSSDLFQAKAKPAVWRRRLFSEAPLTTPLYCTITLFRE